MAQNAQNSFDFCHFFSENMFLKNKELPVVQVGSLPESKIGKFLQGDIVQMWSGNTR